ncbi:MAG: hypothetical protein M3081_10655 [Gemmatimonadota bacterium]|nr:hypothetical protein [Gemmatimonadota bacterium]
MRRAVAMALCLAPVAAFAQTSPATGVTLLVPVAGQKCEPVAEPAQLPSAGALVDSATLVQLIQNDVKIPAGRAVLSFAIDANGFAARVTPIESDLLSEGTKRLGVVAASLAKQQPSGQPVSLRLIVKTGEKPTLEVARSERCHPFNKSVSLAGKGGERDARWEAVFSATGNVIEAKLLTPTGRPDQERAARTELRAMTFAPGLLDRKAIVATDTISYRVAEKP